MNKKTLALLALLLGPAATMAAPVHYDESIDGDLSWSGTLATFNLDAGINTFQGTSTFGSSTSDGDGFAFTVAAGTRVDSLTYQVLGGIGYLIDLSYTLNTGNLAYFGTQLDNLSSRYGSDSYAGTLGPGTYHLTWSSATYQAPLASGNWLFSINVSNTAVPAPGALLLVGLGLAGIGAARRKRRA